MLHSNNGDGAVRSRWFGAGGGVFLERRFPRRAFAALCTTRFGCFLASLARINGNTRNMEHSNFYDGKTVAIRQSVSATCNQKRRRSDENPRRAARLLARPSTVSRQQAARAGKRSTRRVHSPISHHSFRRSSTVARRTIK